MPLINTGNLNREQAYIYTVRTNVRQLWDALNNLVELQRQYNALDYGNTLPPGEDINAGIVAAAVGACVFDTPNALVTVLNAGHATNLAKLL